MNILTLSHSSVLQEEIDWLNKVLQNRIECYFDPQIKENEAILNSPPELVLETSKYSDFCLMHDLSAAERLVLALMITPSLKPRLLDIFFTKNKDFDRGFTEFGGITGRYHSGFLPTIETALFILAGEDFFKRLQYSEIFQKSHMFARKGLILNIDNKDDEPDTSLPLKLSQEYVAAFIYNQSYTPEFSGSFPAKKLKTKLDWEDLVLSYSVMAQLSELRAWLEFGKETLESEELGKYIKPGYRSLFYGPPGTGKTLTVSLLAKKYNRPVYRVDTSQLVSKYIGETEKNLEKIFQRAEDKDWILFFDEADSLFGNRTEVNDSNDRFANQQTSYLLQRIEDSTNTIILASNLKDNIDEAFLRRFQSVVYFPLPSPKERLQLWLQSFKNCCLSSDVDLEDVANKYEIAGGAIINVIRYAYLMAKRNRSKEIKSKDIDAGVRRELTKEGKSI